MLAFHVPGELGLRAQSCMPLPVMGSCGNQQYRCSPIQHRGHATCCQYLSPSIVRSSMSHPWMACAVATIRCICICTYSQLPPVRLLVLITLMAVPQPSVLTVLLNHYLCTLHAPITFLIHPCFSYTLAFPSFSLLIICVAHDLGPVRVNKPTTIEKALMVPLDVDDDGDDLFSPVKWCWKCWTPKPECTHHCSLCGRHVLK